MKTKVIAINLIDIDPTFLQMAVKLIKNGNVVAFPTETVYGLGANAFSEFAVKKIFEAKQRPADNPLIVHVSSIEMLEECVTEIPDNVRPLLDHFWPGALTILFPKSDKIPDVVTAGLPTVAIRMPSHPIANALIAASGVPIAAPSANASGRPSPTTAAHVLHDLNGRIPLIIDGGPTYIGVESTVIDIQKDPPVILRPGGITKEQLEEFLPTIEVYEKTKDKESLMEHPPTPGMKYRHYAPIANVILFEGPIDEMLSKMSPIIQEELDSNHRIGVIHTQRSIIFPHYFHGDPNFKYYPLGDDAHPEVVARGLFKAFRDLDDQLVDIILVEGISEKKEGLAVMNRVRKAATQVIQF